MVLYRLAPDRIERLSETSFRDRQIKERTDLQRLLRSNISVVAPDVLIIAEEFSQWDDSKRRIDLLGVDNSGTLVVIEIKRDEDGGHMDLQAIRYAAMVNSMTFAHAVDVFQNHLNTTGAGKDARSELLDFLEWDEAREDDFARDVRIVLVSADFSKELTTAVLWLNERSLDIRCVRIKPYSNAEQTILDVQQIVPLPEAEEYLVRVREKAITVRDAARESGEDTGYWFMNTGDKDSDNGRSWEDCSKYGFMLMGGQETYIRKAKKLRQDDKLFAYLSGHGYVGYGIVTAEAVPFNDFRPAGHKERLADLPLTRTEPERMSDPERWDLCIGIKWVKTLPRDAAVKDNARNGTLSRFRQPDLVERLLKAFDPQSDATLKISNDTQSR